MNHSYWFHLPWSIHWGFPKNCSLERITERACLPSKSPGWSHHQCQCSCLKWISIVTESQKYQKLKSSTKSEKVSKLCPFQLLLTGFFVLNVGAQWSLHSDYPGSLRSGEGAWRVSASSSRDARRESTSKRLFCGRSWWPWVENPWDHRNLIDKIPSPLVHWSIGPLTIEKPLRNETTEETTGRRSLSAYPRRLQGGSCITAQGLDTAGTELWRIT